jgi:Site-specific DNA methylase
MSEDYLVPKPIAMWNTVRGVWEKPGMVNLFCRALGAVLGGLADLGFDAEWHGVEASDAGAPHRRFRVFILAHASS